LDLSLMEDATTNRSRPRPRLHWKLTGMPTTKVEDAGMVDGFTHGTRGRRAAIASALKIAKHWKASIGFALFDQGMTSFANFALFVIAGRLLPIDEFGNYSIAWVFSMLVVFAATALLVDPLPAITSRRRLSIRMPILAAAVRLNFIMGCALAAALTVSALIARAWSPTYGTLLLCLAITSPLQLLQFASRRFCYLLRREGVAAASAATYAAVLIGGVMILHCVGLHLAVRRRKFGCFSCGRRKRLRAYFEGPCAIVEMAHESMLAFGKMVGRLEPHTLNG
jgi:hypothetical protein